MGKYFVPSTPLTPVDRLRESLAEAEKLVISLRGAGTQVLALLHLLDQVTDLVAEFEMTGADVRAECARLETVRQQLCRRQTHFLTEAGSALQEERAVAQPDHDRWWWFLDEAVAQQRQDRLRRTLTWGLVSVFLCIVAWLVYDRFVAPPIPVRQALRYSAAGEDLIGLGDWRAALTEFEAAATVTPDDPDIWVWLGVIYAKLDELDKAQEAFDTARVLHGTEMDFLLNRSQVYLNVGDLDAAKVDLEQVIAFSPQSGTAYYLRGTVFAEQGEYAVAVDDLERAAELAQEAGDSQLEATARVQRAMVMQTWMGQLSTPTMED
ncbi:MAG: tetratricopeptide repeat protein [Chloroflexi bacterium]|nr:tetratricopeptide repeat protein [Chloroflexota bacterium]